MATLWKSDVYHLLHTRHVYVKVKNSVLIIVVFVTLLLKLSPNISFDINVCIEKSHEKLNNTL